MGSQVHPASVWATRLPAQRLHPRLHVRLQYAEAGAQRGPGRVQHILDLWKEKEVYLPLWPVIRKARWADKRCHLQVMHAWFCCGNYFQYISAFVCMDFQLSSTFELLVEFSATLCKYENKCYLYVSVFSRDVMLCKANVPKRGASDQMSLIHDKGST